MSDTIYALGDRKYKLVNVAKSNKTKAIPLEQALKRGKAIKACNISELEYISEVFLGKVRMGKDWTMWNSEYLHLPSQTPFHDLPRLPMPGGNIDGFVIILLTTDETRLFSLYNPPYTLFSFINSGDYKWSPDRWFNYSDRSKGQFRGYFLVRVED